MSKTDLPDDLYSSYGAGRLAQHIVAYWRARGYAGIVAERFEIAPGTWGVRSNMVGGWPPKREAESAAERYEALEHKLQQIKREAVTEAVVAVKRANVANPSRLR